MGQNRRNRRRNVFKIKQNYIIPFFCVVITCTTIIISTLIVTNLKSTISQLNNINVNEITKKQDIILSSEEKKQINNMVSFFISNIEIGQSIADDLTRYYLVCKFYSINKSFLEIPANDIDVISPEIYRDLGYMYFEDYKDKYLYISKQDFNNIYLQLFVNDTFNEQVIEQYYIKNINGYLVPKDNSVYSNNLYKISDIKYVQNNQYEATLFEMDMYLLYTSKTYEEVLQYIQNDEIDMKYITGKMIKINLIKQNNDFVFNGYKM